MRTSISATQLLSSDWPGALMQRVCRRAFSSLPFRGELVSLLTKERFPQEQAEKLVDCIDSTVCEAISREAWRQMTLEEYEKVLRTYQDGLEAHRKEMHQLDRNASTAMTGDQEYLLSQINHTRQSIREEAQQLESNVKLDLNLERKRRGDLVGEIEGKAKEAKDYLTAKAGEIQESLESMATQAMTSIGATAAVIVFCYLTYKLTS